MQNIRNNLISILSLIVAFQPTPSDPVGSGASSTGLGVLTIRR